MMRVTGRRIPSDDEPQPGVDSFPPLLRPCSSTSDSPAPRPQSTPPISVSGLGDGAPHIPPAFVASGVVVRVDLVGVGPGTPPTLSQFGTAISSPRPSTESGLRLRCVRIGNPQISC